MAWSMMAIQVQRSRGSKVQRFKGSKVQRFKGSKVQRFKGSKVQRFKGSKVQRFKEFGFERLLDLATSYTTFMHAIPEIFPHSGDTALILYSYNRK
jgi:hypothetical protein